MNKRAKSKSVKQANISGNEEYTLVYSTDQKQADLLQNKCKRCNEPAEKCACAKDESLVAINPKVQIERKGRAGKTVTVLSRLPPNPALLKRLCSEFKRSLGGGGTSFVKDHDGIVELQGDQREKVMALIEVYNGKLTK